MVRVRDGSEALTKALNRSESVGRSGADGGSELLALEELRVLALFFQRLPDHP